MDNFNKFKKKMIIEALIKSIALSYAVGALFFGVPYLIKYFLKEPFELNETLLLLAISCSVASIVFVVLFLILFPTKTKAAKRLDKDLCLNQKVQTMIEFNDNDNPMVKLQREDTQNILGSISLKKLTMRFSVFFFVLIGFAVVLTTGVVVAASYRDTTTTDPGNQGYVEPPYDLDDWTVRALLDLIEVVETSNIDTALKTPVVHNLNVLLTSLEEVELEIEMKALVLEVIADTTLRLDLVNSNNEVFTELKGSDAPIVVDLVTQINALNVTNVNNCIENIYVYLCSDPSTMSGAISDLDAGFRILIEKSKLNKDDKLTVALLNLANAISSSQTKEDVSKAINDNIESIVDIIKLQTENERIITYTIEQLKLIFGLVETNTDTGGSSSSNDPTINPVEPPKINPDEVQGGYGSGEVLFGSDDIIFDLEKGSVKYGDVIAKYYGELVGMFNDGTIPEEYKELFDKYFDRLFGYYEEKE